MLELLFAPQTAPFAIALALMLLIALLEGVGLLFGIAFSGIVDNLLPDVDVPDLDVPDVDAPDVDLDVDLDGPEIGGGGPFTQLLGWLSFGRVPALVLLVAFLTGFGLSGLLVQSSASSMFGFLLPAWLAVLIALAVALPVTRYLGIGLGKIMPKEETEAVSRNQFIGKVAIITRGEAKRGLPAEAKLKDHFGQVHYILAEPDSDGDVFVAGTEVLLVRQTGSSFRVIENTHAALSKKPSNATG